MHYAYDLWPYVWLIFKSGSKSRTGYDGARTVIKMAIGTSTWNVETYRNKLENYHTVSVGMIWLEFSIE